MPHMFVLRLKVAGAVAKPVPFIANFPPLKSSFLLLFVFVCP